MADIELIKTDPRQLIDLVKKAYYDETGETLQIGSDEYAAASAFAYVWSVLIGRINDATLNRFIDSATGAYLDAIASNYGIYKRPDGYRATAKFSYNAFAYPIDVPAFGVVVQDSNGNQFTNIYNFRIAAAQGSVVLYSVQPGTKYNGIPAQSIDEIVEGGQYLSWCKNSTMTAGGTESLDDDDAFRSWLKLQIQTFAGAGTYAAYEARAKQADSRVLDVYVLKQNDTGYEKGKVKIYILTDSQTDIDDQVLEIVQNYCADEAFRPIGDLVEVYYSPLEQVSIGSPHVIEVTYPARFRGTTSGRSARVRNEYNAELAQKIGRPFVFEELFKKLCETDSNGVYAVDAKTIGFVYNTNPTPIYPTPGSRVNVDIAFYGVSDDEAQ